MEPGAFGTESTSPRPLKLEEPLCAVLVHASLFGPATGGSREHMHQASLLSRPQRPAQRPLTWWIQGPRLGEHSYRHVSWMKCCLHLSGITPQWAQLKLYR